MTLPIKDIIDAGLKFGIVPDANFHYTWESTATWQYNMLIENGLQPQHTILDIGCESLRLGMELIPYLKDGFYCGIDAYENYILLANELASKTIKTKNYKLILNANFEFEQFGKQFDFATSHTAFSSLSKNQIKACMQNLKPVIKKGGKFIFTFITHKKTSGISFNGDVPLVFEGGIGISFYEKIGEDFGIEFSNLNSHHPSDHIVGQYVF